MPTRFRSAAPPIAFCVILTAIFSNLFILTTAVVGICAPVDQATARVVAENRVRRHIELFGDWNGSPSARVGQGRIIDYQGSTVAYNFAVLPSGHVLVAADDTSNPVPLYSTQSTFTTGRADHPNTIESWIVPEEYGKIERLNQHRRFIRQASANHATKKAWDYFTGQATRTNERALGITDDTVRPAIERAATTIVVEPLIETRWGQGYPYNEEMPQGSTCSHTLTGCVATAWAQVLRYWQWPEQMINRHSYSWNGQVLSAPLSQEAYDWNNMPLALTGASNDQILAVSGLIYDLAVVSETEFGCGVSASGAWADDVLDIYFKYKAMTFHSRTDLITGETKSAEDWFDLFKIELDEGRPVIFSIFADGIGGHEVIVDGYGQDTESDANVVHINFGWPDPGTINPSSDWDTQGYYGFYDVSDPAFFTLRYPWDINQQYMVTGIEPNYAQTWPIVTAASDQTADEGDTITLNGTTDETATTYQWRCIDVPELTITDYDQPTATVRLPNVTSERDLVFRLKAIDSQGGVGFDDLTVTVRDTGDDSDGGGGGDSGGGGCFIETLFVYSHPSTHI